MIRWVTSVVPHPQKKAAPVKDPPFLEHQRQGAASNYLK